MPACCLGLEDWKDSQISTVGPVLVAFLFYFIFLPVMMERVKGEAGLGSGASVTSESTGNGVTPCP